MSSLWSDKRISVQAAARCTWDLDALKALMSAASVNEALRLVNVAVNDVALAEQMRRNGQRGSAAPYDVARALWKLQQRAATGSASVASIAGITFCGLSEGELGTVMAEKAKMASVAAQLRALVVTCPQVSGRRDTRMVAAQPGPPTKEVCVQLTLAWPVVVFYAHVASHTFGLVRRAQLLQRAGRFFAADAQCCDPPARWCTRLTV